MRLDEENLNFYRYVMPAIESNMYILIEGTHALIVDPNISQDALELLRSQNVQNILVLLTHEHFDHISGINWLRSFFDTDVLCSDECAALLGDPDKNMAKFWDIMIMDKPPEVQKAGRTVKDETYSCTTDRGYEGQIIFSWQGHNIRMEQVPGHSRGGSLIWFDEEMVFTGDNLVNGTGVICRLPGSSKRKYTEVTRPILESLPDRFYILPGHGAPGQMADMRPFLEFFGKQDREQREAALSAAGGVT